MVAFPPLLKRRSEPKLTVASLDARHRVQRRSMMAALQAMRSPPVLDVDPLLAGMTQEIHQERIASLRAAFYRLRLQQEAERAELIAALCPRAPG